MAPIALQPVHVDSGSVGDVLSGAAALAWPLLVMFILWRLLPDIKNILVNRSFNLEIGDKKLTVQDESDQVRSILSSLQTEVAELREQIAATDRAPAQRLAATREPKTQPDGVLLWVDDNPQNNAILSDTFRKQGVVVQEVVSTGDAIAVLRRGLPVRAIISDLGRKEDGGYQANAGLELLEKIRSDGFDVPYAIYTSPQVARERADELLQAGATTVTGSPAVLYQAMAKPLGII